MSPLRKRYVIAGLSLAALGLVGCDRTAIAGAPKPATVYTSANVVRQDLTGYLFFDGKVFIPPGAQAQAFSPYTLPVTEVLTAVGKRVGKGQVLIRLAIPGEEASISQAEANLRATQAAYSTAKAQYDAPVKEAERSLVDARAAEAAAREDVRNGGTADLAAATQTRVLAEENLALARTELDRQLLAERQSIAIAAEYLKEARAGSKLASVRAPITGTVVALDAKPGLQTEAKQHLVTVVNLEEVRIQGMLPAEHKDLVKVGSPILISIESNDAKPLEGTVTGVNVLPPETGQKSPGYLVVVKFDNRNGIVKSDTVVKRLGLRTGRIEDALVVPAAALGKNQQGRDVVFVQEAGDWVETPVKVGPSDGALVAIEWGLSEGQVVRVAKPSR